MLLLGAFCQMKNDCISLLHENIFLSHYLSANVLQQSHVECLLAWQDERLRSDNSMDGGLTSFTDS